MSLLASIVALIVLFFVARTWLRGHEEDHGATADLIRLPKGDAIEALILSVVGEAQLYDDHSSCQEAIARCGEGMPIEIEFVGGGPGGVGSAQVVTEFGEIGGSRKVDVYIRDLEGGTEKNRIRSAIPHVYVYKD